MSHAELLQKFAKPGVQGLPCRGLGCPQSLISSSLADGERVKREKKGFSGDTPAPPAEGLLPSCTTRERRASFPRRGTYAVPFREKVRHDS